MAEKKAEGASRFSFCFFSVGKHPMKPGGFVAGVSKGGRAALGTRLCSQSVVCYTLDGGRGRRGLVTGQHKTLSTTQDRRVLRAGRREKAKLLIRKSCLSVKVRECLDGAKREKSNSGRAVRGVQKLSSPVSRFSRFLTAASPLFSFFIFRRSREFPILRFQSRSK